MRRLHKALGPTRAALGAARPPAALRCAAAPCPPRPVDGGGGQGGGAAAISARLEAAARDAARDAAGAAPRRPPPPSCPPAREARPRGSPHLSRRRGPAAVAAAAAAAARVPCPPLAARPLRRVSAPGHGGVTPRHVPGAGPERRWGRSSAPRARPPRGRARERRRWRGWGEAGEGVGAGGAAVLPGNRRCPAGLRSQNPRITAVSCSERNVKSLCYGADRWSTESFLAASRDPSAGEQVN